jgi:hypothetical protein
MQKETTSLGLCFQDRARYARMKGKRLLDELRNSTYYRMVSSSELVCRLQFQVRSWIEMGLAVRKKKDPAHK